jgi:hypothetical protein
VEWYVSTSKRNFENSLMSERGDAVEGMGGVWRERDGDGGERDVVEK